MARYLRLQNGAFEVDQSHLENFKGTLRKICAMIEDLSIENDVCHGLINALMISTPQDLQAAIDQAIADPERRREVHDRYAEMWAALERDGVQAFGEDLLLRLPPTNKPN
jgi:hypothetical protein